MTTVSLYLVAGTFLTAFGSSMLYGFNIGIFNLPEAHVKNYLAKRTVNATEETKTMLYSVATSIFLIGGAGGAFSSGIVADKLGRKVGLLANDGIMIAGAIFFFISHAVKVPELVYVARAIVGISSGMTLGLASMYLTEIAPIDLRGIIGACHQLAVTSGIALSNFLTFGGLLGTEVWWLVAAGVVGIPALIEAATHWLLPESPRYLHMIGKVEEAKAAHKKYDPSCPEELFEQELANQAKQNAEEPKFQFFQIFTAPYSRPMIIACLIQVLQQFSGINAVMSYSKMMMETAGVETNHIQYYAFGVSMFNVVCTIVSLPLLERFGRRPLLLWPTVSLAVSLIGLCISVTLVTKYLEAGNLSAAKSSGVVSVVLIYVYVASFAVGLGTVPALIVSEIFRQGPRGAAYSVSQGVQWACNLAVTLIYPNIQHKLKGYVFLIFLTFVIVIWILFFFIMPETKGLTVDEVCVLLKQPIKYNVFGSAGADTQTPEAPNQVLDVNEEKKDEKEATISPDIGQIENSNAEKTLIATSEPKSN